MRGDYVFKNLYTSIDELLRIYRERYEVSGILLLRAKDDVYNQPNQKEI